MNVPAFSCARRYFYRLTFSLALSMGSGQLWSADVPAGFEALLEEQTNQVDLYYGGRFIGRTLATYAPGWIRFENPDRVAELIPLLRDRDKVAAALSGRQPSNRALSCTPVRFSGCGEMPVDVAGVIFDSDVFRADIIVASNQLREVAPELQKYLPLPEVGPSAIQRFAMHLAGGPGEEDYALTSVSLLGYREARLEVQADITRDRGMAISHLFADRDLPGRYYGGGLFRSRGLSLVPEDEIYGAVYAGTTRNRADREQVQGSLLTVFLARPAQVEIVRDGYLLDSASYEAGNQVLDTRVLPYGTYEVRLRIRESGGTVREERRLFVKDTDIPPADQPLYLLEGGVVSDDSAGDSILPEATGPLLLHARYDRRAGNHHMLGGDVLLRDGALALEAHGLHINDLLSLRGALTTTGNGNAGARIDLSFSGADLNVSGSMIKTWVNERQDPIPLYQVENGSLTDLNLRLGYPLGRGIVSANAAFRQSETDGRSKDFGLAYRTELFSSGRLSVGLSAEYVHSDDDRALMLRLSTSYARPRGFVTAELGQFRRKSSSDSSYARVTASHGLDAPGGAVATIEGSAEHDSIDGYRVGLGGKYLSGYGDVDAGWERQGSSLRAADRYFLNSRFGYAATLDQVAIGGYELHDSAVLVTLAGYAPGSRFDVVVDQQVRAHDLSAGQTVAIPLTPYDSHTVELRAIDGAFVAYDTAPRVLAPFPGNVNQLTWELKQLFVVFGRILLPDGTPASNLAVQRADGPVVTDEQGYFQAELLGPATLSLEPPGLGACEVVVATQDLLGEFSSLGDRRCIPAQAETGAQNSRSR